MLSGVVVASVFLAGAFENWKIWGVYLFGQRLKVISHNFLFFAVYLFVIIEISSYIYLLLTKSTIISRFSVELTF